jgi:nucleotide-binding universal stress UspA family protein
MSAPAGSQPRRPQVVVGVDGTAPGRAALGRAVTEARLRGADLLVVHAWRSGSLGLNGGFGPGLDPEAARRRRQLTAETLVEEEVAGLDTTGVPVTATAARGQPGPVLVRLAEAADLLVVGSCGSQPLAGLLLGSVAQHVARHAACPVLLVPWRGAVLSRGTGAAPALSRGA